MENQEEMKICKMCNENKPLSSYYPQYRTTMKNCITCHIQRRKDSKSYKSSIKKLNGEARKPRVCNNGFQKLDEEIQKNIGYAGAPAFISLPHTE